MTKKEILRIIAEWKVSQKVVDVTDKGLISLAAAIEEYILKRRQK